MKDLKEFVTANLKEGADIDLSEYIDFEKGNEAFNTHINGIVTKSVGKETEKVKGEIFTTFVQELGIEAKDMEGVKLWAKKMNGNTDEYKELNTKLETELNEIKEKYNLTNKELAEFKESALKSARISKIVQNGFDPEQAEFLEYKLSKEVTEEKDFDAVLTEYAKENKPKIDTNKFQRSQFKGNNEVSDSIRKRYPKYFNK